jgi:hypothetical protein
VNRPKRLFTKNTGLCKVERRRIGADACPVPEGYVEVLGVRLEAPKLSPGKRRP